MQHRRQSPRDRRQSEQSDSIPDDPAWLTIAQLCRRWQLGRKTVYKFIDANVLPVWRVSSRLYRVAVVDVLRFEARNRLGPSEASRRITRID